MKVHLHIEEGRELEVHIYAATYNETVEQLMKTIKTTPTESILGYSGTDIHVLKPYDIFSIYTEEAKVFLQTDEDEFECKQKLYELEERYPTKFVRVNKSMLVNLDRIVSIQAKVLGNSQVLLTNGSHVMVSRKYFKLLKEKLGLGGSSS